MRALEFLAKACALLAGLLLTTVTLMTSADEHTAEELRQMAVRDTEEMAKI